MLFKKHKRVDVTSSYDVRDVNPVPLTIEVLSSSICLALEALYVDLIRIQNKCLASYSQLVYSVCLAVFIISDTMIRDCAKEIEAREQVEQPW